MPLQNFVRADLTGSVNALEKICAAVTCPCTTAAVEI